MVIQTITVRIPGMSPTLNSRRHWRKVAEDNAEWKATATIVGGNEKRLWEAAYGLKWRLVRRATISVLFGLPDGRRRDWDNLISSIKPELDGLVAAGLIVDDSIDVIQEMRFRATSSPRDAFTEFEITEVAG